ncbi:MAG TPA: HEPN domain-containing protein [Acetobacteraceae bacterium]|nr:HEPN domain-containing protein [Acetobacteraceae bacterium]
MSDPETAADAWQMALDFLREAEAGSPEATPRMVLHAAYYAMYHAARAVLIQAHGRQAPLKHSVVVGWFGRLAKDASNADLMSAGRLINEMQEERLLSDYRAGRRPPPTDAEAAVRDARQFVEICAVHYSFLSPEAR